MLLLEVNITSYFQKLQLKSGGELRNEETVNDNPTKEKEALLQAKCKSLDEDGSSDNV